jgi:hypothetical protein
MKICLLHFLGRCKQCTPDFDKSHHPNNYDCKSFIPLALITMEVKSEKKVQGVSVVSSRRVSSV